MTDEDQSNPRREAARHDRCRTRDAHAEPFALKPQPAPPPPPEPKKPAPPRKEDASQSPFSVTVGQVYDGPLDLLLDLIRKQNIDIYDIPIAHHHRPVSRVLPPPQADRRRRRRRVHLHGLAAHPHQEQDAAAARPLRRRSAADEDPRRELVERLLEHERFKAAAQMLVQKQQIEEATWTNPGMREFRRTTAGTGAGDRRRHRRPRARLPGHPRPPARPARPQCRRGVRHRRRR